MLVMVYYLLSFECTNINWYIQVRVSIVDKDNITLMDNFCTLDEQMMDYITKRYWITEKDLKNAPCFEDVRETVIRIS